MQVVINTVLKMLMSLPLESLAAFVAKKVLLAAVAVAEKLVDKKLKEAEKTETPLDDEGYKVLKEAIDALQAAMEKM